MSGNTQVPGSLKKSVEEAKVEYVNLEKSGLNVSVPILGAMRFGSLDWSPWVCLLPYGATNLLIH